MAADLFSYLPERVPHADTDLYVISISYIQISFVFKVLHICSFRQIVIRLQPTTALCFCKSSRDGFSSNFCFNSTITFAIYFNLFFTPQRSEGNKWDSSNRPCYRSRIYASTDAFHLQKTLFTHRKNAFFRPEIIHLNTWYRGVIVLHVIAKYQLSQ